MTTIVDFLDRTADVAAFQGWELGIGREAQLDQSLASDLVPGGEVITGIIKLVQRFLIILLTEQGTLVYLPLSGCSFMADARRGRWRTSADVQQSFYFALLDVKRQMRQMELTTDPDDERLADVVVQSIVLSPRDRAVLKLLLTTAAGTTRQFIAPISVVPR